MTLERNGTFDKGSAAERAGTEVQKRRSIQVPPTAWKDILTTTIEEMKRKALLKAADIR
jgi:hypothetical protein